MTREDELKGYINKYIFYNLSNDKEVVSEILARNIESVTLDVLRLFDKVFKECIKLQSKGEKKSIAYICISYLNIGAVNGEPEVQINLYDDSFLIDKVEIVAAYKAEFLSDYLKSDIDEFNKYLKLKMIRLKYNEMYEYRKVVMVKYKSVLEQCFINFVPVIIRLKSFVDMRKSNNFKITYGEYMCESIILYNEEAEV